MRKVLIVTHNARFLVQFELQNIDLLKEMGYEVHCATNLIGETMIKDAPEVLRNKGVSLHQVDIQRSPYKFKESVRAYCQLKSLLSEGGFCAVLCHTPMGGVLGRLAANATNTKPVIYTAHGFHFYKGCPLKNRLIYETVERLLARYTDAQITINQEDFSAAKTFHIRGKAYYTPGVGIDIYRIQKTNAEREKTRLQLGISNEDLVYITVGELIPRKGHEILIKAFSKLQLPGARLIICGSGKSYDSLQKLAIRLGVSERVHFLGFRRDVYELLKCADVFVFPSKQEGLPVALMEAMAAGLPCVASRIRGNVDLLPDSELMFDPNDENELCICMQKAIDVSCQKSEIQKNLHHIANFSKEKVQKEMRAIYSEWLRG